MKTLRQMFWNDLRYHVHHIDICALNWHRNNIIIFQVSILVWRWTIVCCWYLMFQIIIIPLFINVSICLYRSWISFSNRFDSSVSMFCCVKKTLILPCHSTRCVQSIYFSKKNIFFSMMQNLKGPHTPSLLATKFNKHFYVEIVWGNKKNFSVFGIIWIFF